MQSAVRGGWWRWKKDSPFPFNPIVSQIVLQIKCDLSDVSEVSDVSDVSQMTLSALSLARKGVQLVTSH